jgi:hypothetical protein
MRMKLVILAVLVGAAFGGVSAIPVYADGENCTGCCAVTTDCGSPTAWRCCLPKSGEAPCGTSQGYACPNYCFESTSCSPIIPE